MVKISVITPTIRPKGLEITRKCLLEQTFRDFEWLVDINTTGEHDFNASCNRLLKRAQGELIVSLQDYIKVEPDYLEKCWKAYQEHPDTFFTTPVGKVKDLDYSGDVKWDWRNLKDGEVHWDQWEIDSGFAPLSALKAIGGFDEEIDGYWSCDNVNVGCRAQLAGYKFRNLQENKVLAYDHDAFEEHPFRHKFKPEHNNRRMDEFRKGLKLKFNS